MGPFEDPVLPPVEFDVRLRIANDHSWVDGLPKLAVDVERIVSGHAKQCSDSSMNARFLLECGRCSYNTNLDAEPPSKRHKALDPASCIPLEGLAREVHFSPSHVAEICRLAKRAVVDGPSETHE